MRFYVISVLVLIPLLSLLSLLQPLFTGFVEKPIGPAFTVSQQTTTGNVARGEALYRSKCYGCHVPEAKVGPTDLKTRYSDSETITLVVRSGRQPMPAFNEQMLSEQELADLIAYIRSLPKP